MRQPGFGDRTGGEVFVIDCGKHLQRWGSVRWVAARRLAAEFPVDLGCRLLNRHPCLQEYEDPSADGARVERTFTPPGEVAVQDVGGVEGIQRD